MLKTAGWLVLVALFGCDERERFILPTDEPGRDEIGPVTDIDIPGEDTVLVQGGPFVVGGRSVDSSGIDTVYIAIDGGDVNFAPIAGDGADTVRFGLPIPTNGPSGRVITITVRGVDLFGNRGSPVFRQLTIQ